MKPMLPTALVLLFGASLSAPVFSGPGVTKTPRSPARKAVLVTIVNFRFTPATVTVPVGTCVTWRNDDDVPHTVVSTRQAFRSRAMDTGDAFSYTFRARGTYAYFCSVHPMMTAKVVVR